VLLVGCTIQCERPHEKKIGYKEDKRQPERKVEHTEGESAFQRVGPIEANDRD